MKKIVLTLIIVLALLIMVPTTSQVAGAFGPNTCPSGMVGYWTFDAGDATDDYGSNNGTIYGANVVVGKVGSAMIFDGNDYIDTFKTASDLGINGSGPKSICAWAYTDSTNVGAEAVWEIGGQCTGCEFTLRTLISPTSWYIQLYGMDQRFDCESQDAWVHFCMVYDGAATTTAYANGTDVGYRMGVLDIQDERTLKFGKWSLANYYHGMIDEVAVFNKALSSGEIQKMYNDSLAGKNYCGTTIIDVDNDGIADAVDTVANFSNDFDDRSIGGTTFGTIENRADIAWEITEMPNPDGVKIKAFSGAGTGEISACSDGARIQLTSGDEIVTTCGSTNVAALAGEVGVVLDTNTIKMPAGSTVKIETVSDGWSITKIGDATIYVNNQAVNTGEPFVVTRLVCAPIVGRAEIDNACCVKNNIYADPLTGANTHGDYVSCVSKIVSELRTSGVIDKKIGGELIKAASQSNVNMPINKLLAGIGASSAAATVIGIIAIILSVIAFISSLDTRKKKANT